MESALCAFVHEFQLTVSSHLVSLVQRVQTTDASADLDSLRLKEAGNRSEDCNARHFTILYRLSNVFFMTVYKAVELCAFDLYDDIDYDSWYQSQLLRELEIQDSRSVATLGTRIRGRVKGGR